MLSLFETVLKNLTAVLLFLLLSAAVCRAERVGTVTAAMLNVRSGPDNRTAVVKVLARGEKVRVLAEEGEWLRIAHGRERGYIRNRPRYVRLSGKRGESAPRGPAGKVDGNAGDPARKGVAGVRPKKEASRGKGARSAGNVAKAEKAVKKKDSRAPEKRGAGTGNASGTERSRTASREGRMAEAAEAARAARRKNFGSSQ